ncbi:MAG: GNAT family N-acetyltransferase [Anaerolineales bacterium]|nr:GNAT family N-acetyltransferase [Anaerolineales bacterium]MDP2777140.1 GNAT family N-acetyltransferase [Anaerolineales bacterium]
MTNVQTQAPLLDSNPATTLRLGLSLRAAQWADLNSVAKLIYAVCEADGDTTVAVTPQELKHEWQSDGFNPETDAFLVETKDGGLVGYEEFFNKKDHVHLNTDGYVHPEFKGLGIGTTLLQRVEQRAREEVKLAEPDLRVFIRSTMDGKDDDGRSLHTALGYSPVRFHWRMEIKLEAAPPAPVWPEGIELRPFAKDDHAVAAWQADNEAFREHWGSHNSTIEEWSHRKFGKPDFDPTLWMMAWDGDQIAGFSQNRFRMGIGWVGSLGVRHPWRKKGLGLALLQHSFGEFYRRGMKIIGLGVDASNPTGATHLYLRAGMYVASEFVTFEKELRPGRDLAE